MARKALRISAAIAAAIAVAALAVVYYKYNPLESCNFPKCAFLRITGLKCPGCGSQRAVHYLLHGQIGESFRQNPLLWVGAIYIAATQSLKARCFQPRLAALRERLTGLGACIAWLAGIIAFWILRNVV